MAGGISRLVGHDPAAILSAAARILDRGEPAGADSRELFGDGRAAIRIADVLALARG